MEINKHEIDCVGIVESAVFVIDNHRRIISWNGASEKMFGYEAKEMIGQDLFLILMPQYSFQRHSEEIFQCLRSQTDIIKGETVEVKCIRRNKEEFPARGSFYPTEIDNRLHTICIVRDFNNRKIKCEKFRSSGFTPPRQDMALQQMKMALQQKDMVLQEILAQLEAEKNKIKDTISKNIQDIILPMLKKIRLKGGSRKYSELIERHLRDITTSFSHITEISDSVLTRREIEICHMVKSGLTSKEIANLLSISCQTVEKHREHIRKKIGLTGKHTTLANYLYRQ